MTDHVGGNAREPVWLGVDLGTQGVRVLAATATGTVVAKATAPLRSTRDGVRHEQDPHEWWSAFVRAAGEVAGRVAGRPVEGLAVCSTSGTVLFVEEVPGDPARPVTPALMYDDGRAGDQAARLAADPAPGWAAAGARPQASWGLAKALWLLAEHDVPKSARLAHQVDVVTARLAGSAVATDWSHALKSGVDLVRTDWPYDVLDRHGLPVKRLPPVVAPGAPIGEVGPRASELTGIPGNPDPRRPHRRVRGPGRVGRTGPRCVELRAGNDAGPQGHDRRAGARSERRGLLPSQPGRRLVAGWCVQCGRRGPGAEFPDADLEALDAAAEAFEPATALAYPLVGKGERFPVSRPDATGFLTGSPSSPAERYAAHLQGVVFVERLCLAHVQRLGAPVGPVVTLTGGGARSSYWPRLHADILDREVVVPEVTDGAFGMAVVAAAPAHGSLTGAAAAMVRERVRHAPVRRSVERFDEAYGRWLDELRSRRWT